MVGKEVSFEIWKGYCKFESSHIPFVHPIAARRYRERRRAQNAAAVQHAAGPQGDDLMEAEPAPPLRLTEEEEAILEGRMDPPEFRRFDRLSSEVAGESSTAGARRR